MISKCSLGAAVLLLLLAGMFIQPAPAPQGHIFLVGGGNIPHEVDDEFVRLAGGGRIVVIPTASSQPETIKNRFPNSVILHTTNRNRCYDPDFYKPLETARGVWMSGGDQVRLVEVYKGTPVEDCLKNVVQRGGVVGGTSAGASAASKLMMYEGECRDGLGLMPDYIVDQHFSNRERLPRLLSVLNDHPEKVGIGIDEETAVVIDDSRMRVIGKGSVKICKKGTVATYQPGAVIPR